MSKWNITTIAAAGLVWMIFGFSSIAMIAQLVSAYKPDVQTLLLNTILVSISGGVIILGYYLDKILEELRDGPSD